MVNAPRCFKRVFEILVKKVESAKAIPQVHIDNAPWRKDCFLVWVAESSEYFGYFLYAFHNGELFGVFYSVSNGSACARSMMSVSLGAT